MTFLNGCISPVVGHPSTTQQPASHLLACLSRCLGEPAGECQRILGANSRYLEAVERFRNAPQSQACLNRHVASFQFAQKDQLDFLDRHDRRSRLIASYHAGDFIYGANVYANHEASAISQFVLLQHKPGKNFQRNMGDIPNACLRDNVSAVLHDDKLLPGDIAFNISLDYAEFNRQKLQNLCRKLDILQLIENLPMGFGTQLGESETCFSAGQRQRLLIARALYRNPKILLLDEALANLSIDSAKQILAVLRASRITTLFVAHDAELIRCADSVVHLAQNSFISQGG